MFRAVFSQNVQNPGELSVLERLVLLLLLRLPRLFLRWPRFLLLVPMLPLMLLCCCCSSCCCCCCRCCWRPAVGADAVTPGGERLKSRWALRFRTLLLLLLQCGHLWPYRSHFRPSWGPVGGQLGLSGPFLGPCTGHLGDIMGTLGGILAVLGPSWNPPWAT